LIKKSQRQPRLLLKVKKHFLTWQNRRKKRLKKKQTLSSWQGTQVPRNEVKKNAEQI